jgi:putative Mg2+ transporter-C (MgtC) family protein
MQADYVSGRIAMLAPMSWWVVVARFALALGLGALIGLDRELSHKAAGLRTNMLVTLGTALLVIAPIQSGLAEADGSNLARVIQGVVTGVGFVGAGSIFREDRVRGLTSAAAVWVSAGVGIAAGLGQWQAGLLGTLLALGILRIVKWLESYI